MKVNNSKTKLLCISDSLSFRAVAFIKDVDGTEMWSAFPDLMKMLGFHFSESQMVLEHVRVMVRQSRSCYWILFHLWSAGFNKQELVRVYKSIILPVHDYLTVVYYSMLTDAQDEEIERL